MYFCICVCKYFCFLFLAEVYKCYCCFWLCFSGSHATMLGLINLFVHTVMYSYYFLTSLRPAKEMLWWKRHITQLQLVQFGYLVIHFLVALCRNTCDFPNLVALIGFMQNIFMFVLFFEFYYRNYIRNAKSVADEKCEHRESGRNKFKS